MTIEPGSGPSTGGAVVLPSTGGVMVTLSWLSTARALAGAGFRVVCAARRADRIEALAAEIDGTAITCDVTSPRPRSTPSDRLRRRNSMSDPMPSRARSRVGGSRLARSGPSSCMHRAAIASIRRAGIKTSPLGATSGPRNFALPKVATPFTAFTDVVPLNTPSPDTTDAVTVALEFAGTSYRVLVRITPLGSGGDYPYQARVIKRLPRAMRNLLGIFRALPGGGSVIDPIDRDSAGDIVRDAVRAYPINPLYNLPTVATA